MKGLKSLKPDIVIIDKDNTLFDNNDENNEKKEIVLVDNILIMLIWKVKMIKMMNRKNH